MKGNNIWFTISLMAVVMVLVQSSFGLSQAIKSRQIENDPQSFAVVELFTSEGCSSCPPADRLLSEITADAHKHNRRIYPLSFHVDYWNYIGWTDPFSDLKFSNRQRTYARVFEAKHIYTPQMIINGKTVFIGSDRKKAFHSIDEALNEHQLTTIHLKSDTTKDPDTIVISYEVSNFSEECVLHIALVESGLVNQIKSGENSGRALRHDNVVRLFITKSLEDQNAGYVELKLQPEIKKENISIIGFIQNPNTMEVIGAAELIVD